MAGEPAMSASDAGIRTRTRSRSRDAGLRRLRSRSRSPPDRRFRHGHADGGGYRYRGRDDDGDLGRGREGMGDDGEGEIGRSAKRRRFDYQGEERVGERLPRGSGDRDRSPERRHYRRDSDAHGRRRHSARRESAERTSSRKNLPFGARQLSRSDLAAFRPLFAHYLDLQKRLDISSLDETELRGRWKSFMGKWNRGELADGWYDPEVFARAARDYKHHDVANGNRDLPRSPSRSAQRISPNTKPSPSRSLSPSTTNQNGDEDDDFGPPPPPAPGQPPHHPSHTGPTPPSSTTTRAPGPSIPTQTDLSLRDEALAAEHSSRLTAQRLARRAHRAEEKALLDETLPRAEAGTRERRLEKRRELNEKLKGFREKSPGGEVGEGELMGGGDAVEEYRAMLRAREEKRRERVSKREEVERARRAEREERVRCYREREERVLEGLRALARERFGGGGEGRG